MSMDELISRHFITINDGSQPLLIHYRKLSAQQLSAQPCHTVVMLHPSPLSSHFMQPLMPALSACHDVIAWDTPGYGDSQHIGVENKHKNNNVLHDYCQCLSAFITALKLERVVLYGNATGAQIAIEFAKLFPEQCERLMLENVAIFHRQEREAMLAQYFPDLTPTTDGSHVEKIWEIVNKMYQYFPWYDERPEAKLSLPTPSIELIQQTALDYLKAGSAYADAYIAAMQNEKLEQLVAVPVAVDIVLWPDSIIYSYCQRLAQLTLPDYIKLHPIAAGMDARLERLTQLSLNVHNG